MYNSFVPQKNWNHQKLINFYIPITFNNLLKVGFMNKKYLITSIQTRPTQIVKVYFLNLVLKDLKNCWCTKSITYHFLFRFSVCNKATTNPNIKPLISLLNIKSAQKVLRKKSLKTTIFLVCTFLLFSERIWSIKTNWFYLSYC